MSYRKSLDFCVNNTQHLYDLAKNANIVICPSFIALAPITEIFKNSSIFIGAQNCSEYASGSYTGEISAESLAEIGVTHCIIGHSERRIHYGETTETIIKKMDLLYHNAILPIICIGETKEDFLQQKTHDALQHQLELILKIIAQQKHGHAIIAYEPFWAIGTGIIPENKYLADIFAWLQDFIPSYTPQCTTQLLYGGSITTKNIHQLKTIPHIDGFLVGGASTDFEEFAEIITP
jgi:triosephosphate isomerase